VEAKASEPLLLSLFPTSTGLIGDLPFEKKDEEGNITNSFFLLFPSVPFLPLTKGNLQGGGKGVEVELTLSPLLFPFPPNPRPVPPR